MNLKYLQNNKKTYMKLNLALMLILLFISSGVFCQDSLNNFDYGKVENYKYSNSFFNYEITLPVDWIVQTKEQTEELAKTGKELLAGDDAKMKAVIKASEVNSAFLLTAFQYETGAPVDYNASISILSENIKNYPGIKNGSDYLFQAKRLMEQSQFKYDHLDKEFDKKVINGVVFYTMNARIKYMGQNIKQVYYSTILNGFSLNIIISFVDKKQKKELFKSIDSITFVK
jgi:hypothetical protein